MPRGSAWHLPPRTPALQEPSLQLSDYSGRAGAFCDGETTSVFEEAADEPDAAIIFCAETTPTAARPKLVAARIMVVSRMIPSRSKVTNQG